MNRLKKLIAGIGLCAMVGTSFGNLSADDCCYNYSGCGYQDCCRAPCVSPYVALGVVAVAAVVAVIVNNKSKSSHDHNSASSS